MNTDENQNQNPEEKVSPREDASQKGADESLNEPFGDGKTVLIVEDDPTTIEIIRKLLTDRLFEVFQATDGKKAWDKIRPDLGINLIISDFLMPEMDGFQFFKGLKKEDHTKNIPVIFLSARKNMEDSLLVAGADAFLSKPINTQEFLETVKKMILRGPVSSDKKDEGASEEKPAEETKEEKKEG